MKRLIEQRYIIHRNFIPLIGLCLFVYFSWHAGFGARGILTLNSLESRIEKLDVDVARLTAEREALESKVVHMRPHALDPDLLEEQAREVLGFQYADDRIILN